MRGTLTLCLIISLIGVSQVVSLPLEYRGERAIVELWDALIKLRTTCSFLETGAHPDDEQSALLAYIAKGIGARTGYVLATRGEGGQNAIGKELMDELGVLRTFEITEAEEVLGTELWVVNYGPYDSIIDFGFSKTAQETFAKWGHDVALERLVRIIRTFRPDVVFNGHTDSGHGHHRAMHFLTREAVEAAADPTKFPEHLQEGLQPWRVKKLYEPADQRSPNAIAVPVGEYNPTYGLTYQQIGQISRNYHASQSMGGEIPLPAPTTVRLARVWTTVTTIDPETSVFDGLPFSLSDWASIVRTEALRTSLTKLQNHIETAINAYPQLPEVLQAIQAALVELRHAQNLVTGLLAGEVDPLLEELAFKLAIKEQQLSLASAKAACLVPSLIPSSYEITRGVSLTVTLRAFCGGAVPIENVSLDLLVPEGWEVVVEKPATKTILTYSTVVEAVFRVNVPQDASFYNPYRQVVLPGTAISPIKGVIKYTSFNVPVEIIVYPARDIAVLPDVSIHVDPPGMLFNVAKPQPLAVRVTLTSYVDRAVTPTVALTVPQAWTVEPSSIAVELPSRGASATVTFTVHPLDVVNQGLYFFYPQVDGGVKSSYTVKIIDYPHVGKHYIIKPAELKVVVSEIQFPDGLRVGYVDSGMDTAYQHLRNLGIEVDLLSPEQILTGDLSKYDTIVFGIRAYRTRPDLIAANSRILEYIRNGGNLVVQYHQSGPGDNWDPNRPPYRLVIGSPSISWRVTDENAEVTILVPDHPLLNYPNKIGPDDWEGWQKERGIYFASEWDPAFTPLLSMADPGEPPLTGGLLVAEYGKGRYIYVSLVLYYQLENLVPGAFRLFANLITPPPKG